MTAKPGRSHSAMHGAPESVREEALRSELVQRLALRTGSDGRHETAIPALLFYRYSLPTKPAAVLQEPAVYVVAQGRKQVTVGENTLDLPRRFQGIIATP